MVAPEFESAERQLDLCLASLRFFPVYAGPAVRFQRYAPGLRSRGVRMRVFAGAWRREGDEEVSANGDSGSAGAVVPRKTEDEYVEGIPIHRIDLSGTSGQRRIHLAYTRALARYCLRGARPDVVQLLSLTDTTIPHLLRLRAAGIPLVYTHTMLDEVDPSVRGRLKEVHRNLPLRLMDCVVVSSGVMRDSLRRAGVRGRIEVIPNGLDTDRFKALSTARARVEMRDHLGLPRNGELIVFVGGYLKHRKGIDVLADAWRLLARDHPNAHLVFVGPRHDDLRPAGPQAAFLAQVSASLTASGAADRVVFTGAVKNVEAYLQVADVFVFPSRKEGMPNVVPEAFGCGAVSILTPFLGLPAEFGRPGIEYVLVDRTPEALANSITHLLDHPEERQKLARAARSWVEDHLDVERSLDRYAELYYELAGGHDKRRGFERKEGPRVGDRRRTVGAGSGLRAPG